MGFGTSLVDNDGTGFTLPDVLTVVLYFVVVIGVGLWASFKRASTDNARGYFLAGSSTSWILIGASTYATNIGAPMFIGLPGSAANSGLAVVMFEWHAMFMLILLGWVFLPVYRSSGCITMPQYLKMRYGGNRIRLWLAVVHCFLTIVCGVAGQIYSGALFITKLFNWNLYVSIIFILIITVTYTVIGGLTAVLWTDAIQTVILVIGSCILAALSLHEVGGYESMKHQFLGAAANYTIHDWSLYGNRSCGFPPDNAFHIFRSADDPIYPWPGIIFGLTILATNSWCTDQLVVQRSLSAKSVSHAKAGVLLAAYLKATSFIFFVIPGMISRVLFPEEISCADPNKCDAICRNQRGCTNIAYPMLVNAILPTGIKGLMLAALLAALMSSLTSIFNSNSSLFTMDIWGYFRPKAKQAELMVVGRLWTILLMFVGICWLPILLKVQGSDYWAYSQSISSFILPPIVVVFLLGIFWPRATEKGAFCGLVVGLLCGIIRMALQWSIASPACGSGEENQQFAIITKVHYLHFAIILAIIVTIVIVTVSFLTERRPDEKLRRVTWWTKHDPLPPAASDDELESESENETDELAMKDISENESAEKKIGTDVSFMNPGKQPSRLGSSIKYYLLKWGCGIDKNVKSQRFSKAEKEAIQAKLTDIQEDPFWKKVLDVNMVICAAFAIFLHAFWA